MSENFYLSWQNLVSGINIQNAHTEKFSGFFAGSGLRAVIGPNGCGKSTLLKTWLGVTEPLEGKVNVHSEKPLGFVPQQNSVNSLYKLSVKDFVSLGLGRNSLGATENKILLGQLAETWELNLSQNFHELSAGQKTRALVARALALAPDVIFLDEPLANLDKHCQTFLMEELHRYSHEKQMSVVIVDHHLIGYERWFSEVYEFKRQHNSSQCEIALRKQVHKC